MDSKRQLVAQVDFCYCVRVMLIRAELVEDRRHLRPRGRRCGIVRWSIDFSRGTVVVVVCYVVVDRRGKPEERAAHEGGGDGGEELRAAVEESLRHEGSS